MGSMLQNLRRLQVWSKWLVWPGQFMPELNVHLGIYQIKITNATQFPSCLLKPKAQFSEAIFMFECYDFITILLNSLLFYLIFLGHQIPERQPILFPHPPSLKSTQQIKFLGIVLMYNWNGEGWTLNHMICDVTLPSLPGGVFPIKSEHPPVSLLVFLFEVSIFMCKFCSKSAICLQPSLWKLLVLKSSASISKACSWIMWLI